MSEPRYIADPSTCTCGLLHPAYGDCDLCRGHGTFVGGDEDRLCFACRDRFRRQTAWLDYVDRELDLAKETAWD